MMTDLNKTGIQGMYAGDMNSAVSTKFSAIKDYLLDKGNHICQSCGGELVINSGCTSCPNCGSKDCGS